MKIIYDHQIFSKQQYGGISRYFYEISNRIPLLEGDSVEIFAPFHVNEYLGPSASRKGGGIKVPKILGASWAVGLLDSNLGQMAIKRKRDVAIYHETYYSMASYSPATAKRVITVHDMIHERFPQAFAKDDKTSEIKRHAVNCADHVICVSESTRRDLIELTGVSVEKTSVIYHGHKLTTATKIVSARDTGCKPYLLYVGARGGYKNFDSLLVAYSRSDKLRREFSLICFGGGKFTAHESSLMKSLGLKADDVIRAGGGDVVLSSLYATAAAFIYPSLYEGFGIPPLEAMSHGCPVICTNTSSLPEVVGNAAELFCPWDQDALTSSIERVVGSSERSAHLVAKGYQQAARFSWEKCALETLNQYKRLLLD
jgi:glycosyltransferase involved in cell wall biosynthesis